MAFNPTKDLVIPFNKGLNQQVSTLELGPSELFSVINYEMTDGAYAGLRSICGYERYDGTTLASETPIVWLDDELTTYDDTNRLAARELILEVPGSGPVIAVFEFNKKEYAIRYNTDRHELYESTALGWVAIASFHDLDISTASTVLYDVKYGRFAEYPSVVPNEEVAILCNGVSAAVVLSVNVTGDTIAEHVAGGDLPTTAYPTVSLVHTNKLLLAFPNGNLFLSGVGSPMYWSAALDLAITIFLGDEITNLVAAPSSIFIAMENSIKVMTSPDGIDIIVNSFSDSAGALKGTAVNFLGTIVYCNNFGIVFSETSNDLGDFKAAIVSSNIQKTFLANKDRILGATVDAAKNQYIIFLNDGSGIINTFYGDRTIKGSTLFRYNHIASSFHNRKYFGSTDGYVYKVHEDANSFDCSQGVSVMRTSYYTYKAVNNFKRFIKFLFELSADKGTKIYIKPDYEYNSSETPKTVADGIITPNSVNPGIWGIDDWGSFVWAGSAVGIAEVYTRGMGSNMSINISSSNIYKQCHTIHNTTVSYQILNRRL